MAQFTSAEWDRIEQTLETDPTRYGFPERVYGSVLIARSSICWRCRR